MNSLLKTKTPREKNCNQCSKAIKKRLNLTGMATATANGPKVNVSTFNLSILF